MSSSSDAPRDALAATHMWVPVDATGSDFYDLGSRFGTQVGVLSEVHKHTGHPYPSPLGTGCFDPRSLRWHQLQRPTPTGTDDNRLCVQVVTDYEAEYADARAGDAPFGQPEFFTALNRTTREADTQGRVALTTSHRRVIDSEDDRYALALTCRSVTLSEASLPPQRVELDVDGSPVVPGVAFRAAGSGVVDPDATTHGGVTTTAPSVSFGGVTFFGGAAQQAAREALAAGGSMADAARWASAAARGVPRPPLLDAGPGPTRVRQRPPAPPEPDRNPGGSVPLLNHPKGYVWSEADRIGLLGTLVVPEGASGAYFTGREGTPIGPLPLRHDAQVSMTPELVGRVVFVSDDASSLPEGSGKPIKGELWADASRANVDTELGLETLQWRPVLKVDADLPPSRPPPPPPPWIDPPPEDEDEDDEETGKGGGRRHPPRPPTGGRRPPPPRRRGPGESSGEDPGPVTVGGGGQGTPVPPRGPVRVGGDGRELPPVTAPGSQARDYEGPGAACPNTTAGVRLAVTDDHGQPIDPRGLGGVVRVPGGYVEASGYAALSPVDGGVVVGGEEPRGRIPLGLPLPPGRGVVVDPAPEVGLPRGAPAPNDERGEVPLGLPGPGPRRGGLVFEPGLGGDDGIPRGYEERLRRRQRRARARRRREARERREQERLDELEELELAARRHGRTRFAGRVKRARERLEQRRQKRAAREERLREFREQQEAERERRRRAREARRERRRRERAERRRARRERRRARKRRPTAPQGGYVIDLSDPDAERASVGRLDPEAKRLLERDRERARARRRRYLEDHGPSFGDWNVANARLPFFGAPGGPASIEGWAHLATYQLRALQEVVTGAFGGPRYFAGNLGVVHRNRPGSPPVGSRLGAHWTAVSGERLCLARGQAPVELVSVLEAQPGATVCAREGGVVEAVREHRGEGIEDLRPLLLLENDRGSDHVRADLVSDVERCFYVDHRRRLTACALRAVACPEAEGALLEVGRERAGGLERFLSVEADGTVCVSGALKLGGRRVTELPQALPEHAVIPWAGELVPDGYELWEGPAPTRWIRRRADGVLGPSA